MVLILLETVIDLNATVDSCLLIKCIQQYIAVMMGCVFDICILLLQVCENEW